MRTRLAPALALCGLLLSVLPARASGEFLPSVELRCKVTAGSNTSCSQNTEPDVKVAPDGTAYLSAILGVPGGTNFWRRDVGSTFFDQLGTPEYMANVSNRGFALGGGDTALAIAPERNARGNYNVYVASLYAAGVTVAVSGDKGTTWTLNHLSAPITSDRQWLVARGASTVFLAYQDFTRGSLPVVARSDDAGATFGPPAPVYEPVGGTVVGTLARARFGTLTLAPDGTLYWPFSNVADEQAAVEANAPQNALGINKNTVHVAYSTDGVTWRNTLVYAGPAAERTDAVFPWLTTDAANNVYVVWSNTHGVFLSRSFDRAGTWSAALKVSQDPVASTVLPTVVGGRAGTIDIGFYGTASPSVDDAAALWNVYFVQSLDAAAEAPTFTQVVASDQPAHKGSVCLRGLACDLPAPAGEPGDRALSEILTITLDADGYALLTGPYDFRGGKVKTATQSFVMKQSGLARAFDSELPLIGLTTEPK
jgi:hypothetical protein